MPIHSVTPYPVQIPAPGLRYLLEAWWTCRSSGPHTWRNRSDVLLNTATISSEPSSSRSTRPPSTSPPTRPAASSSSHESPVLHLPARQRLLCYILDARPVS